MAFGTLLGRPWSLLAALGLLLASLGSLLARLEPLLASWLAPGCSWAAQGPPSLNRLAQPGAKLKSGMAGLAIYLSKQWISTA